MKDDNLSAARGSSKRIQLWIAIGLFAVIVISFMLFQQTRKQEFIHYLQQVEECFKSVDTLQELSLKANQAGMAGDPVRAIELTDAMIRRSEEFLEPFKTISVHSNALRKIHDRLLELNDDTHRLLLFRSESLRQLQDPSVSTEEKQKRAEEFWGFQDQNQSLFRALRDDLHKYGKRVGVNPEKYLTHFL